MTLPPPLTPMHTALYQITLCPHHCATIHPTHYQTTRHTDYIHHCTHITPTRFGAQRSADSHTSIRESVCNQLATGSGSSQSTDNRIKPARCGHESVSSINQITKSVRAQLARATSASCIVCQAHRVESSMRGIPCMVMALLPKESNLQPTPRQSITIRHSTDHWVHDRRRQRPP
jgi:hypothetical protein